MVDAAVDRCFVLPLSHNPQNAILFCDDEITTSVVHVLYIATHTPRTHVFALKRPSRTGP